jgi:hypothetical protein
MSEENKMKTIVLQDGAIQKIDHWIEQVEGKRVRLSRKEFLHWFIKKSPENLSNADLSTIAERYYDEEKFLRQLLRETRQAKKDGQVSSMEILVRPKKGDTKREVDLLVAEEEKNPSVI